MDKKCSVCGKKADIVVNVYLEGFVKEIAYCKDCLKKSIDEFKKDRLRLNLDAWSIMNSRPKVSISMELVEVDSVSFLAESAKSMLGTELREQEKVNYKISRLRRKMAKAIKNENYELAGIIQREIERLKSAIKRAK
jgi:protein-arginine kinase activator protein McsA